MGRFFATTLGQILLIIAISTAITFVLILALLSSRSSTLPPSPPWPWPVAYRIAAVAEYVHAAPERERPAAVAAARRRQMAISLTRTPAACERETADTHDLEAVLRFQLRDTLPDVTARSCDTGDPARPIQVLLGLGDQTLDIRTGRTGRDSMGRLTFPFAGALLFLCVAVAAMSAWAVSRVIRPLQRLSDTVEDFGRNVAVTPIEEEGPLEIQRAARAFNLMQERTVRLVRDRTRMLAAISHDLRTPLTRMRLLVETGPETAARNKLLGNIDLMQSMVASALAFLSGSYDAEEREWLDLGALLSTLCDDYQEAGAPVSYEGPAQIKLFCRPNAINRALTNLIENGIRFGKSVLVRASVEAGAITVDVIDDGPGIPQDQVEQVVEPFVRLDQSGGAGLGLSIVKEIVEAHGGTLTLINRKPAGLTARLTFRKPPSADAA